MKPVLNVKGAAPLTPTVDFELERDGGDVNIYANIGARRIFVGFFVSYERGIVLELLANLPSEFALADDGFLEIGK